ncbi:MAG: 2,3-bisphosphoglycerate-independent phosphoglycerate mutase [Rhodothermales bacterium]|nr:2,3-bisphosphoglycerate-independent phosphoglycerate mutase [Rhodothermales bacterium]
MKKHLLLILDGYGIAEDPTVSAIDAAEKPFLDDLFARYPHGTLRTSGLDVGLPEGQMGNSEVGHMNLGAGRVVYQEITRIDKAIEDGSFFGNDVLVEAARRASDSGGRLHLIGLLSDGGVHSHQNHLHALLELAASQGLSGDDVCVHAFMDGRDTDPHGGERYLTLLDQAMDDAGVGVVASVVGRYYAMDRDNRWERTEQAYRLLVGGEGGRYDSPLQGIRASYDDGVTDEFVKARAIGYASDVERTRISGGDSVIFFNFRADRARQITRALTETGFDGFERTPPEDLFYVTFTPYDEDFDFPVAFPKVNLTDTIGEVIAGAGARQLRAAETEKYPHVTYFFSGGREDAFENEDRILVPSPKVATYDLQPEMSAPELARRVAEAITKHDYTLVVLNFANPDMVGHTGDFEAAVRAVEAVDAAAREVVEAAVASGYGVSIIADHGNADRMRNPDGSPHTAHTTVPVPHLVILDGYDGPVLNGRLADISPTILAILGIEAPDAMTGDVLVDVPAAG